MLNRTAYLIERFRKARAQLPHLPWALGLIWRATHGWTLAWAALTVFIGSCAVQVRVEEAHLEASFGQHYREFRASIPRWIGIGGRA